MSLSSNSQAAMTLADVVEGDRWDQTFTFVRAATDFTTVSLTSKLRRTPNTAVVFTFTATPVFPTPSDKTTFTVTLTLTGANTDSLGVGSYVGDIVMSMAGFGPYTPIRFTFNITSRISS